MRVRQGAQDRGGLTETAAATVLAGTSGSAVLITSTAGTSALNVITVANPFILGAGRPWSSQDDQGHGRGVHTRTGRRAVPCPPGRAQGGHAQKGRRHSAASIRPVVASPPARRPGGA